MSRKRSKSTARQAAPRTRMPPAGFITGMDEVEALMARKRWVEARAKLEELDRRYPHQPDILINLVNVNYELHDMQGYQIACTRLLKVDPDNPEALLGLAGAYMTMVRPALAIRQFHRFLHRYPDHERAPEVRVSLADLEEKLHPILDQHGFAGEDGIELAQMHEEVQVLLESGNYVQSRQVAEQLLQRKPDFVSGLNNLSQVHFFEGNLEAAIAVARRVLALEPDNFHGLSNLTRFLWLGGQSDEARSVAARLQMVTSHDDMLWTKQAEALALLGDDEGVLAAFRAAEERGALDAPISGPLIYHLAAVATLRRGDEREARRLWKQALKMNPGFDLAKENLNDLQQPIGEREGPWPYTLNYWLTTKAREDLVRLVDPATRSKKDNAVSRAMQRFLRSHPEVIALVPMLLERGDPGGRDFALRLAMIAETPALLASLRNFAFGQHGSDQKRIQAAQAVMKGGLLPSGQHRMWIKGEWQEIMLFGFEISGEQMTRHTPKVDRLIAEGIGALNERDGSRAEQIFKRALELEPNSPGILNNLAMAYEMQKRSDEAETLIHETHERFPDYLFARVGLARLAIRNRDFEHAQELLDPLLHRTRLHHTEATALFNAEVELADARKERESALHWLEMWAAIEPDNPTVAMWRLRLEPSSLLKGLLGRRGIK